MSPSSSSAAADATSAALENLVVTLPVELNASSRAKQMVYESGFVTESERGGVSKVLSAAAMTYVAAALTSIATLLYYLMRAGLLGGRSND